MIGSSVCRAATFNEPWFGAWALKLGIDDPARPFDQRNLHRKVWEWVCIAQVAHERGLLRPGASAIGFAVGKEMLPSLFASYGTQVLATDSGDPGIAAAWKATNEHSASLDDLFYGNLVERTEFERLVRYANVDMNDLSRLPAESVDFTWSACALEHLGSIEAGMRFVVDSTRLLKPGGVGIHTTEYNLSSVDKTVSSGPTVLYRKSDLERLDAQLRDIGATLAPLDLDAGNHPYDLKFDVPPFSEGPRKHLKLRLMDYVCTSVMLVVQN